MKNTIEFLNDIVKERPVGSEANSKVLDLIQSKALKMGYEAISLPFDCKCWEKGKSFIEAGRMSHEIFPSPFSNPYNGYGTIKVIRSLEELENADINEKILLLRDKIAQEPLMPKNYPFYYPDEHKHIIDLLEEKKPKAIIAATGKHPMCGLDPFPMFEDGNFSIPSAYISEKVADNIFKENGSIKLCIDSGIANGKSNQIIAAKKAKGEALGKIIVCAHMDSKYDTAAALDNAVGVAVMFGMMQNIKDFDGAYDIDFIPFNGEEYYEAKGELECLKYLKNEFDFIKLVINIDSPCYKDSKIAVASYNLGEELNTKLSAGMMKNENIVTGEVWYAGDHSIFAYKGISCISITSSNLLESALDITHTQRDTIEHINYRSIEQTVNFLTELIKSVAAK